MKNLKIILIFFAFTSLCMLACRKFVTLDSPKALVVSDNAFREDAIAISTLSGIYAQMSDREAMAFKISAYTGYAGDELKTLYPLYIPIYQNAIKATDDNPQNIWFAAYYYIYQANSVYAGCDKSTTLSESVKKQLMGEARFLRAFWYFYLVNLYGDVPLITLTDYNVNALANRTPKNTVYNQIIDDLLYAQANLNGDYVAGNSVTVSTDRVRANKAVATALLARVYLYTGKYADAITQSTTVIANSAYQIESISRTFLLDSKEAIWQFMKPTPATNYATSEGVNYVLTARPGAGGAARSNSISSQLFSAFDSSDLRFKNWLGKIPDPNGDYYYPFKYKQRNSATPGERSVVIRLAEMYLIRSEAKAQNNDLAGAIDDLDMIRKRAGIFLIRDINPTIGKDDLLKAIFKERQKELFTEWGHRWLDLKRTGKIDEVMNVVAPLKGGTWNTKKQLWPIPQKEIGNDPNLVQNPGYN